MIIADCRKCKRWQLCPGGKAWYSYADIRWCPYQILWLLRYAATFHAGKWPPTDDPDTLKKKGKQAREAYFAKAVTVIGEVEARLGTAGDDGKALRKEAAAGRGIESLTEGAYQALMYCKGKGRKDMTYPEWKWQRLHRAMIDKIN